METDGSKSVKQRTDSYQTSDSKGNKNTFVSNENDIQFFESKISVRSSWSHLSSCSESQWTQESLFSVAAQRKETFIQSNSLVHCSHFSWFIRHLPHIKVILLFEACTLSSSICGKKKCKEGDSFSANSGGPTVGLLSVYESFELCQNASPPHHNERITPQNISFSFTLREQRLGADCGCEIASNLLFWVFLVSVFQSVPGDMVSRGFHLDFSDPKCSSYSSHSHFFILGKWSIVFAFVIFIFCYY